MAQIIEQTRDLRHGIYVPGVTRGGAKIELTDNAIIAASDIATFHGVQEDLQRLAGKIGPAIIPSDKTDFVFHGLGLVVGLLAGLLVLRIGSIPLTLGAGAARCSPVWSSAGIAAAI